MIVWMVFVHDSHAVHAIPFLFHALVQLGHVPFRHAGFLFHDGFLFQHALYHAHVHVFHAIFFKIKVKPLEMS